jgi:hypothetical protein
MVWRKMKKHSAQLSIDGDPNPSGWVLIQRTQTSHQASLSVVQGAAAQCAGLSANRSGSAHAIANGFRSVPPVSNGRRTKMKRGTTFGGRSMAPHE